MATYVFHDEFVCRIGRCSISSYIKKCQMGSGERRAENDAISVYGVLLGTM